MLVQVKLKKLPEKGVSLYNLSSRELEVFRLLCAGKLSQEIADTLSISKRTVDKHLEHIYKKLSVKNRQEAIEKLTHLIDSLESGNN